LILNNFIYKTNQKITYEMKNIITLAIIMVFMPFIHAQHQNNTKYVVMVALDGLRWQEVFTGADQELLNDKNYVKNIEVCKNKYWDQSVEARREKLMPFIWKTIALKGQIYGNRNLGCKVNVKNPYWFSYPGFSEILCGYADKKINSNSYGPNPNMNILEFIGEKDMHKGKTAAFTSWDVFPDIINAKRSGVLVNSAFMKLDGENYGNNIQLLNKIQHELPDVFYGIRLDAVTFNLAFEFLKEKQPHLLFIALDETDDFAHHGSYDYYLNSIRYSDKMIGELWGWIQNNDMYKNKTTLILLCDHGRGIGSPDWKSHGANIPHSDETWLAFIGPDTPALGVITEGQFYNDQIAETITNFMGYEFISENPTGDPILNVFGRQLVDN